MLTYTVTWTCKTTGETGSLDCYPMKAARAFANLFHEGVTVDITAS